MIQKTFANVPMLNKANIQDLPEDDGVLVNQMAYGSIRESWTLNNNDG